MVEENGRKGGKGFCFYSVSTTRDGNFRVEVHCTSKRIDELVRTKLKRVLVRKYRFQQVKLQARHSTPGESIIGSAMRPEPSVNRSIWGQASFQKRCALPWVSCVMTQCSIRTSSRRQSRLTFATGRRYTSRKCRMVDKTLAANIYGKPVVKSLSSTKPGAEYNGGLTGVQSRTPEIQINRSSGSYLPMRLRAPSMSRNNSREK